MKKLTLTIFSMMLISSSSFAATAKSMNVRVNPLAMLIGVVNADIDFGITDGITLGPSLSMLSAKSGVSGTGITTSETKISAYSIGARANFYFSGVSFTDGWYFGPSASYLPVSVTETEGTDSYSASMGAFSVSALLGYQWMWETFNINLGLGAGYYSTSSSVTATTSSGKSTTVAVPSFSGVAPSLEFSLGYAF